MMCFTASYVQTFIVKKTKIVLCMNRDHVAVVSIKLVWFLKRFCDVSFMDNSEQFVNKTFETNSETEVVLSQCVFRNDTA